MKFLLLIYVFSNLQWFAYPQYYTSGAENPVYETALIGQPKIPDYYQGTRSEFISITLPFKIALSDTRRYDYLLNLNRTIERSTSFSFIHIDNIVFIVHLIHSP